MLLWHASHENNPFYHGCSLGARSGFVATVRIAGNAATGDTAPVRSVSAAT
jgi:hypothetical protein